MTDELRRRSDRRQRNCANQKFIECLKTNHTVYIGIYINNLISSIYNKPLFICGDETSHAL